VSKEVEDDLNQRLSPSALYTIDDETYAHKVQYTVIGRFRGKPDDDQYDVDGYYWDCCEIAEFE